MDNKIKLNPRAKKLGQLLLSTSSQKESQDPAPFPPLLSPQYLGDAGAAKAYNIRDGNHEALQGNHPGDQCHLAFCSGKGNYTFCNVRRCLILITQRAATRPGLQDGCEHGMVRSCHGQADISLCQPQVLSSYLCTNWLNVGLFERELAFKLLVHKLVECWTVREG